MSEKLLNCPFCGSKARVDEFDDGYGALNCSTGCKGLATSGVVATTWFVWRNKRGKEAAIAAWNRRVEPKKSCEQCAGFAYIASHEGGVDNASDT